MNPTAFASFTKVLAAAVVFHEHALVKPLQLATRLITRLTEARVHVSIETPAGEFEGEGAIYLSPLWAWPDSGMTYEACDNILRRTCKAIADHCPELVGEAEAHPLELGLHLHDMVCVRRLLETDQQSRIPSLALAMCLSPFDAAIHDAVGRACGVCAMNLYDPAVTINTMADRHFKGSTACHVISDMLKAPARLRLPAWVVVSPCDDLQRDIKPWFDQRGCFCLKLKLRGQMVAEDVSRTIEVSQAAHAWGCKPRLCVDANEACKDAEFVLEYLQTLKHEDEAAFVSLEYMEQPTSRDIVTCQQDWHEVALHKPVMLDEGLDSLDLLPLAVSQGWSGLAIKTCKGHSFSLVAAAWAYQHGLLLSMQDLTNPGISAVHAALFASRLPTINGVELNSPQFTPDANADYIAAWPGLFDVRDGHHALPPQVPVGLGSVLPVAPNVQIVRSLNTPPW